MPEFTPFNISLWILTIVFESGIVIAMLARGSARRWPSLACYLTVESLSDIALLPIAFAMHDRDAAQELYFWVYWGSRALSQLAQIWIIWQLLIDIAGIGERAKRLLARGFALTIAGAIGVSAWITGSIELPSYVRITRQVLMTERCLSFAWVLAILAMVMTASFAGLKWAREAFTIAFGFTFNVVATAVCSSLVTRGTWESLFFTQNLLYFVTLVFWGSKIVYTPSPESVSNVSLRELEAALQQLQIAYTRFRSR